MKRTEDREDKDEDNTRPEKKREYCTSKIMRGKKKGYERRGEEVKVSH